MRVSLMRDITLTSNLVELVTRAVIGSVYLLLPFNPNEQGGAPQPVLLVRALFLAGFAMEVASDVLVAGASVGSSAYRSVPETWQHVRPSTLGCAVCVAVAFAVDVQAMYATGMCAHASAPDEGGGNRTLTPELRSVGLCKEPS
mmetsp:Transcript_126915/g.395074  ORF Transcript_126915/g.395074 Transcript_126915/m.395074 type:complete len:144 (+) Transcript_126915:566-997(+)